MAILFNIKKPQGKKHSYSVPDDLSEITLKQLVEFQEQVESHKPESLFKAETAEMGVDETLNYILTQTPQEREEWLNFFAKQVSFWSGMPLEDAKRIKVSDLVKLRALLLNVFREFRPDADFAGFKHNGVEYTLPEPDMENSVLIEFVEGMEFEHRRENSIEKNEEASEYEQAIAEAKNNRYRILPKIMALLARPVVGGDRKQYSDTIVEELEPIFWTVPCSHAMQVAFFLLRQKQRSMNGSQTWPTPRTLTLLKPELTNFRVSLVGMGFSKQFGTAVRSVSTAEG